MCWRMRSRTVLSKLARNLNSHLQRVKELLWNGRAGAEAQHCVSRRANAALRNLSVCRSLVLAGFMLSTPKWCYPAAMCSHYSSLGFFLVKYPLAWITRPFAPSHTMKGCKCPWEQARAVVGTAPVFPFSPRWQRMLLRDEGWAVPAPPVESLDLSTRQGQAEQCGAHPLSQTWSAGCLQELWVPVLLWILMAPTGHPRPASRALQINLMAGVPASAPMGRVRLGVTLSVCLCVWGVSS